MIDLVVVLVVLASLAMSALRRLRVAQREHYVPGRVRAIERLWLSRSIRDVVLGLVAAVLAAVACVLPSWQGAGTWATLLALPAALIAAVLPWGLSVRGRTSKLAWTHRLRRLAMGWAVGVLALGAGLWWLAGAGATALLAVTVPATMDAALWLMERVERRLSAPFVARPHPGQPALRPRDEGGREASLDTLHPPQRRVHRRRHGHRQQRRRPRTRQPPQPRSEGQHTHGPTHRQPSQPVSPRQLRRTSPHGQTPRQHGGDQRRGKRQQGRPGARALPGPGHRRAGAPRPARPRRPHRGSPRPGGRRRAGRLRRPRPADGAGAPSAGRGRRG